METRVYSRLRSSQYSQTNQSCKEMPLQAAMPSNGRWRVKKRQLSYMFAVQIGTAYRFRNFRLFNLYEL